MKRRGIEAQRRRERNKKALNERTAFGWVAGGDDVKSHEAKVHAECDETRKGGALVLEIYKYIYNTYINR